MEIVTSKKHISRRSHAPCMCVCVGPVAEDVRGRSRIRTYAVCFVFSSARRKPHARPPAIFSHVAGRLLAGWLAGAANANWRRRRRHIRAVRRMAFFCFFLGFSRPFLPQPLYNPPQRRRGVQRRQIFWDAQTNTNHRRHGELCSYSVRVAICFFFFRSSAASSSQAPSQTAPVALCVRIPLTTVQ